MEQNPSAMAGEPTEPVTELILRERITGLERELTLVRERLRQLEEIDRVQTDFAFAISHELRTPLTLISGYTQKLLMRWRLTDEDRRRVMIEKINVSSHRLSRLIDDMMLLTDVERGELLVHLKSVAVEDVASEVLGYLRDRYPDTLPHIEVDGSPITALADGFRLEQVLISLLDNAVKHAPPGSTVTLAWRREGAEVVLTVSDQGSGIDAADIPRLFMRFARIERAMNQSHGGVGLGLYIARRLTEAMGGRIWVESAPGMGSAFFVALKIDSDQPSVGNRQRLAGDGRSRINAAP